MSQTVINPTTSNKIREYENFSDQVVEQRLEQAALQYISWKKTSFAERAQLMNTLADLLEQKKETLARIMCDEMGKVMTEGRAEAEKCAWVCRYYAEHAEEFLANRIITSDASKSYVSYQPIGAVLAIMPWNFPFWQVFRFAAPTVMAGNVGLLKHASNVPGCSRAIESLFEEAGFPEHVFQSLLIGSDKATEVIADPRIKAVTLTGSNRAGKAVAAQAGKYLKKTVLELGGSDAYVVLDDAPIKETVEICVKSRLQNAGQSCIAAKRFIVTEKNYQLFTETFVNAMKEKQMGDPYQDSTDIGPQARKDLRDELHEQVTKSIDMGAVSYLGCEIPSGEGAFYPPSVLGDVTPGMPAFDEELFGPVAAIIKANDKEDAIRLANLSIYGLGGSVFTADREEGERIAAEELEAGFCCVNDYVRSAPNLPFGGIKESGYGRELSEWGIHEFMNIKTVFVK